MIVWRLSFTSNGRNAILIEESSWLLEWNRTIHHPIDLSIITCAMCNTVMLHGWCSCIYGKFKSTRFIRSYFEFFTIEYMFNIYIYRHLSFDRIRIRVFEFLDFVRRGWCEWVLFNKEERKVEKNSVLDFVYSLSIYEYL